MGPSSGEAVSQSVSQTPSNLSSLPERPSLYLPPVASRCLCFALRGSYGMPHEIIMSKLQRSETMEQGKAAKQPTVEPFRGIHRRENEAMRPPVTGLALFEPHSTPF